MKDYILDKIALLVVSFAWAFAILTFLAAMLALCSAYPIFLISFSATGAIAWSVNRLWGV
jgi:hypothetical protein